MIKFNGLGAMLEWKYGLVASTRQVGETMTITEWRDVTTPQPDEAQLEQDFVEYDAYVKSVSYKDKRKREYPSITDQMDAVVKALKHLKTKGVDIGLDGSELVTRIDTVKTKYPKPKKGV